MNTLLLQKSVESMVWYGKTVRQMLRPLVLCGKRGKRGKYGKCAKCPLIDLGRDI